MSTAGADAGDSKRLVTEGGGGESQRGSVASLVALIVIVAIGVLCLWLWSLRRWWKHRERSDKVLHEIEMEFVDDPDDDNDILPLADPRRWGRCPAGCASPHAARAGRPPTRPHFLPATRRSPHIVRRSPSPATTPPPATCRPPARPLTRPAGESRRARRSH